MPVQSVMGSQIHKLNNINEADFYTPDLEKLCVIRGIHRIDELKKAVSSRNLVQIFLVPQARWPSNLPFGIAIMSKCPLIQQLIDEKVSQKVMGGFPWLFLFILIVVSFGFVFCAGVQSQKKFNVFKYFCTIISKDLMSLIVMGSIATFLSCIWKVSKWCHVKCNVKQNAMPTMYYKSNNTV